MLGATITPSMARPPGRLVLVVLVVALATAALAPAASGQADPRPNIVFVMTDDQTTDSLKVMSKVRGGLALKAPSSPAPS